MSIISIEQLKRKLRWENITLERRAQSYAGREYRDCVFKVLASNAQWPSIDLHFNEDITVLDPLGFSRWHAHYDSWSDNRRNLVDALRTVRKLIAGQLCLLEQLNAAGDYCGGSILEPNGIPDTLSKEVRKFRRVFFNKTPIEEQVDFGRYWEGKSLWVEWNTKRDTEKIWKQHGMPITW